MTPSAFGSLFALFLFLSLATRLWLLGRQIRHVAAHREAVPGDFAARIALSAHQRAADYTLARCRLARWEALVSALFALALTLGGGLQWLSDLTAGWLPAGGVAQGAALLAAVVVVNAVVDLPFTIYRTFGVEARFGFNRMTPALFVADTLKAAALAVVLGLPLLAAVLWLMAAMGDLWWVWVWAFWLTVNVLVMLIWPTFIAPLFNRFEPLEDESLKARIEGLLKRCGYRSGGLFVMDGSKRSAHGNAYFTGLGAAKRIVFFDTLLEKLAPAEVEAVLAHELGHFHHHHLGRRLAVTAVLSLGFLALLGWLIRQDWFFTGLGVSAPGTAAALALFMLALPIFLFPLAPLGSAWSRRHEFQADAYAAKQSSAEDLVAALVKLYQDNAATLTPDPVYSAWNDSHPPALARVRHLHALGAPR